jgi:hypothetical protein
MRTIIAGSRGDSAPHVHVVDAMLAAKRAGIVPTIVLSGTARGIDQSGEWWAGIDQAGEWWAGIYGTPVERYPAQWDLHGRLAGKARNVKMAEKAEALVAVWDGKSPGTKHMIDVANRMGLKVYVHRTDAPVTA